MKYDFTAKVVYGISGQALTFIDDAHGYVLEDINCDGLIEWLGIIGQPDQSTPGIFVITGTVHPRTDDYPVYSNIKAELNEI